MTKKNKIVQTLEEKKKRLLAMKLAGELIECAFCDKWYERKDMTSSGICKRCHNRLVS